MAMEQVADQEKEARESPALVRQRQPPRIAGLEHIGW